MQINQATPAMQSLLTSTPVNKAQTASTAQIKEPISDMQKLANKYDINNISYDEMQSLTNELRSQGILNPKDAAILGSTVSVLEHFDPEGGSARINAVQSWEDSLAFERTQPDSIGIESSEHALNIFKGLEALRHANIPHAI